MAEEDSPHPASAPWASNVSFRTRARTIDHLGRGQITDAPTAVSEHWKNAWDTYAANVSLDIFDSARAVVAVFDDGVGMSAPDFVDRWLAMGTESKIDGPPPPPPADFVGPARQRQGEEGIGRLSAAFLAARDNGPVAAAGGQNLGHARRLATVQEHVPVARSQQMIDAPPLVGVTASTSHGSGSIAFTVVAQLRGAFAARFLLADRQ